MATNAGFCTSLSATLPTREDVRRWVISWFTNQGLTGPTSIIEKYSGLILGTCPWTYVHFPVEVELSQLTEWGLESSVARSLISATKLARKNSPHHGSPCLFGLDALIGNPTEETRQIFRQPNLPNDAPANFVRDWTAFWFQDLQFKGSTARDWIKRYDWEGPFFDKNVKLDTGICSRLIAFYLGNHLSFDHKETLDADIKAAFSIKRTIGDDEETEESPPAKRARTGYD